MKCSVKVICVIVSICLFSSCERRKVHEYDPETSSLTSTTKNNVETSVSPEPLADSTNARKSHSYGVAKNGVANEISINAQKYFDENDFNAFCLDTKSKEKVLYLTFDCGYENGYTSKILDVLKEKNVPSAFFCTLPQVKENPELIQRMINEGHIVGNHSVTHPSFAEIGIEQMTEEINGMEKYLKENFNYSEPYVRFPKGEYTDNALKVVDSLGYTSVFWSLAYADWDLNNQKGEEYAFDKVVSRLHPGAVILLHSVSPGNANALGSIIDEARNQGYKFCSLREYPKN
jgi:peptidoglycan-N-acetylmuramic acid deacetylase